MKIHIMGISGSPTKNRNTDRLIQSVLDTIGLSSKFVKLSKLNVSPLHCLSGM